MTVTLSLSKGGFPFPPTVGALSTGMTEKGTKIVFQQPDSLFSFPDLSYYKEQI